jgi:hypothetical protein
MFDFHDGMIVRSSGEGALPIPIASWLRYRNLSNAGASKWRHYAYPARAADLTKLLGLLPGILEAEAPQSAFEAASLSRRSGGAARLLWSNETVRAARVMPPVG